MDYFAAKTKIFSVYIYPWMEGRFSTYYVIIGPKKETVLELVTYVTYIVPRVVASSNLTNSRSSLSGSEVMYGGLGRLERKSKNRSQPPNKLLMDTIGSQSILW